MRFNKVENKKSDILIIRLSAIGDVVLATAALQALLDRVSPENIIWLGTEPSLSLIKNFYPEIKSVNFKTFDSFEIFSHVKTVIDLQVNRKSTLFCCSLKKLIPCKVIKTKKFYVHRYFLILRAYFFGRLKVYDPASNHLFQYQSMVDTVFKAGFLKEDEKKNYYPSLSRGKTLKTFVTLKEKHFYLGVALGASFETKRAPLSLIASIMNKLNSTELNHPLVWIFLGDKQDQLLVEELLPKLHPSVSYKNLAGTLNLVEVAKLLSNLSGLLTNDSGLLHIAEAVKTPVVALFGPTVEEFGFKPHLRSSGSFSSNLGCRPCSKHGSVPCRYEDLGCFEKIPIEKVADFVSQLL